MKKTPMNLAMALILSLSMQQVLAQEGGAPDPNIMPNQGSAFGINNAYSTNYFDGSVNINVPIFDFSNELNVGVSLGYNTRGVLVDEISSVVGLHWNLNAGPSIQRVVKDLPDELNYDYPTYDWGDSLYLGSGEYGVYNYHRYVKGKLAVYGESAAEQTRNYVYRDSECDDFNVEIGGYTFTFNLGKNGYIFTHPKRNITITPTLDGIAFSYISGAQNGSTASGNKLGFIITDELGNKYYFIAGEIQKKRYYDNSFWEGDEDEMVEAAVINKWVIDKIVFADGSVVDYDYSSLMTNLAYTIQRSYSVSETADGASFVGTNNEIFNGWVYQLQQIRYPNNKTVQFSYHASNKNEAGEPMITEISVTEGSNCLKYLFSYTGANGRWYLDEINNRGCGSTTDRPYYSFGYEDEYTLPARLHSGKDLMGYYNADSIGTAIGASGNKITTPSHNWETGLPNYGMSRFTVYWRAKASLLNKIRNAYGGSARFYYSGTAAVPVLTSLPTGENYLGKNDSYGLKVDSIVEVDPFEPTTHQKRIKITYANGQIFIPGGYFHYPTYVNSSDVIEKSTYQSNYLTAHDLVKGSNHGYTNVTIKEFNASNQLLGRTDLTFTNIKDPTVSTARYYTVSGSKKYYEYPYTNKQYLKDWEIGLPLEIATYDHNEKLVEKTINTYTFSAIDAGASGKVVNEKRVKVSTGAKTIPPYGSLLPEYYANKKLFTDAYYPYTGYADLTRTVKLKYASDTRFVADTLWNTYDSKRNMKTQIIRNSTGAKLTTRYVYNYDVDGPASPYAAKFPGTAIYDMTNNGIQKLVSIERWDEENAGTKPYSNTLINADIAVYNYQNGKLWLKGILDLATDAPISYSDYTGITSGTSTSHPYNKILDAQNTSSSVAYFQRSNEITKYDAKGNASEYRYLGKDAYSSVVWDTTSGNTLAQFKGARYNEIGYTSFEDLYSISTGNIIRGNFQFKANKVIAATTTIPGVTGKYLYQLTTPVADSSNILGTENLVAGQEYILSLWARSVVPKVYIGTTLLTAPTSSSTIGSWNNYIFRFTPAAAAKVKIAPATSTSYVDEIRLFPSNTQVSSNTYAPLFGPNSSTDERGEITYFEYDQFGNQTVTKDQWGNVLQKNKYYYIGGAF